LSDREFLDRELFGGRQISLLVGALVQIHSGKGPYPVIWGHIVDLPQRDKLAANMPHRP